MSGVLQEPTMKKPGGVTLVWILILLAALANVIFGGLLMLSALRDKPPTLTDVTGQTHEVPGYLLVISGLLTLILGLLYFWLAGLVNKGSRTGQVVVSVLAVLNIVFGLFALPQGWFSIIINILILILINSGSAKEWFSQNP